MDKYTIIIDINRIISPIDNRIYGQFIEHLDKCIYGGIWVGEESKIPNVKGFRKDVLEYVRAIKPPIIRWPGGNFASGYHFIDGIGPRNRRPMKLDLAWNEIEPNQFGTDEFIEWVKLIGSQPYIVVNAGNGSPEEAAHWVEYTNRVCETYYANLRRKYGHREPYNVKLWGIWNELYGEWQIGFCIDGKECARRTIEFANEMRKVDENIELVGVGTDFDQKWNYDMVRYAGKYIDYLSIHTYVYEENYMDLVSCTELFEKKILKTFYTIEDAKRDGKINKDIKIAYDEWNVWYPEARSPNFTQITSLKDAIFTALVLNVFERYSRMVSIANFAQTVNVLPLILTRDDGSILLSPQYFVFKLYSKHGSKLVYSIADGEAYFSKKFEKWLNFIDVSASINRDRDKIYLHLVNRNPEKSYICRINIRGFIPKIVQHSYITSENIDDKNTWRKPNKISIVEKKPRKWRGEIIIPSKSVNLLILSS
ncbi:MAG TPA: alpha-N-arabinofuranosidase [Thermoprotei archaeon]|nr:alpha-N-arabinofuranosidase [Thermoprotei archaeon]